MRKGIATLIDLAHLAFAAGMTALQAFAFLFYLLCAGAGLLCLAVVMLFLMLGSYWFDRRRHRRLKKTVLV